MEVEPTELSSTGQHLSLNVNGIFVLLWHLDSLKVRETRARNLYLRIFHHRSE
jgi:hypothetical protein